jgi:aminopeptidase
LTDPRVEAYASLLVERCLGVQPGWQVLIRSTPLARPALEALQREIARRGAYAILRLGYSIWPLDYAWAAEAPDDLLAELGEIDRYACDHMDARITIDAPENTREGASLTPGRLTLLKRAERYFFRRSMGDEIPWVSCLYPTQALAQEANLTLGEFEDLVYGACLVDWDAEGQRLRRYADRFDAAEEVRIVGAGTDLTLSLAGRRGEVDDGRTNMPGGEFFYAPVEDSAEGVIEFAEFPSVYQGHEFTGIRLRFREGRVVDASAARGEEVLLSTLDRDQGARAIGELGIGCNPGIRRPLKNTLFDEKIDGSVHLALGQSYPKVGGTNLSVIHWDIVKDLRSGGRLELDGKIVQENGIWAI